MKPHRRIIAIGTAALAVAVLAVALATGPRSGGGGTRVDGPPGSTSGSATIPQPPLDRLSKLTRSRLAPDARRVDLAAPTFSNPTRITNALFPVGTLRSALIVGKFEGKPLRIETTLIPGARTVDWNGERVKTLQSQFLAFLDGRIYEVAVDKYAQDDRGAVWYFGEDAFSYSNGVVADTGDTWLAGVDGPAAMIMPSHPEVGDVYRTENAPGHIFEQVTVRKVNQTVHGPTGPIEGAMVGQELHMEGDLEDKTFAPGYGEFFSGLGRDYEANALALPADSASGPTPAALEALSRHSGAVFDAARSRHWNQAAVSAARATGAWRSYRTAEASKRLAVRMNGVLDAMTRAVRAHRSRRGTLAALDVAEASLDLQLRYRPAAEIDAARFDVWSRRLAVDAAAGSPAAVRGDVATLRWIRDRVSFAGPEASSVDDGLRYLRAAADAKQLPAAAAGAARLRRTVAGLKPEN